MFDTMRDKQCPGRLSQLSSSPSSSISFYHHSRHHTLRHVRMSSAHRTRPRHTHLSPPYSKNVSDEFPSTSDSTPPAPTRYYTAAAASAGSHATSPLAPLAYNTPPPRTNGSSRSTPTYAHLTPSNTHVTPLSRDELRSTLKRHRLDGTRMRVRQLEDAIDDIATERDEREDRPWTTHTLHDLEQLLSMLITAQEEYRDIRSDLDRDSMAHDVSLASLRYDAYQSHIHASVCRMVNVCIEVAWRCTSESHARDIILHALESTTPRLQLSLESSTRAGVMPIHVLHLAEAHMALLDLHARLESNIAQRYTSLKHTLELLHRCRTLPLIPISSAQDGEFTWSTHQLTPIPTLDVTHGQLLNELAIVLMERRDYRRARRVGEKCVEHAQQSLIILHREKDDGMLFDRERFVSAYLDLGHAHGLLGKIERFEHCYEDAAYHFSCASKCVEHAGCDGKLAMEYQSSYERCRKRWEEEEKHRRIETNRHNIQQQQSAEDDVDDTSRYARHETPQQRRLTHAIAWPPIDDAISHVRPSAYRLGLNDVGPAQPAAYISHASVVSHPRRTVFEDNHPSHDHLNYTEEDREGDREGDRDADRRSTQRRSTRRHDRHQQRHERRHRQGDRHRQTDSPLRSESASRFDSDSDSASSYSSSPSFDSTPTRIPATDSVSAPAPASTPVPPTVTRHIRIQSKPTFDTDHIIETYVTPKSKKKNTHTTTTPSSSATPAMRTPTHRHVHVTPSRVASSPSTPFTGDDRSSRLSSSRSSSVSSSSHESTLKIGVARPMRIQFPQANQEPMPHQTPERTDAHNTQEQHDLNQADTIVEHSPRTVAPVSVPIDSPLDRPPSVIPIPSPSHTRTTGLAIDTTPSLSISSSPRHVDHRSMSHSNRSTPTHARMPSRGHSRHTSRTADGTSGGEHGEGGSLYQSSALLRLHSHSRVPSLSHHRRIPSLRLPISPSSAAAAASPRSHSHLNSDHDDDHDGTISNADRMLMDQVSPISSYQAHHQRNVSKHSVLHRPLSRESSLTRASSIDSPTSSTTRPAHLRSASLALMDSIFSAVSIAEQVRADMVEQSKKKLEGDSNTNTTSSSSDAALEFAIKEAQHQAVLASIPEADRQRAEFVYLLQQQTNESASHELVQARQADQAENEFIRKLVMGKKRRPALQVHPTAHAQSLLQRQTTPRKDSHHHPSSHPHGGVRGHSRHLSRTEVAFLTNHTNEKDDSGSESDIDTDTSDDDASSPSDGGVGEDSLVIDAALSAVLVAESIRQQASNSGVMMSESDIRAAQVEAIASQLAPDEMDRAEWILMIADSQHHQAKQSEAKAKQLQTQEEAWKIKLQQGRRNRHR